MNVTEHLNEKQLSDYFGNALETKKKHEIGRHLLQCDFCLERLPKPSPEQFWAALMTENDVNDLDDEKTETPLRSVFFTGLFTPPKLLAWGAGGMVIALIITVLILFNLEKPLNEEREVAKVFNVNKTDSDYIQNEGREQIIPPIVPTPKSDNSSDLTNSNRSEVFSKPKELNLQKREPKLPISDLRRNSAKKDIPREKENISSTRGVSSTKCSEENSIEMEVGSDKTQALVFRWMKVANALKYHLYISDDEEILIDEYETEQETTFVLNKPLDPLKTYKWKIIVTLENGKMVIGDSQKFRLKDFQINQKKPEKKKRAEIRCSANG